MNEYSGAAASPSFEPFDPTSTGICFAAGAVNFVAFDVDRSFSTAFEAFDVAPTFVFVVFGASSLSNRNNASASNPATVAFAALAGAAVGAAAAAAADASNTSLSTAAYVARDVTTVDVRIFDDAPAS